VQIKRKKLFAYLFESFASVSPQPQEKKTKKKKKNKISTPGTDGRVSVSPKFSTCVTNMNKPRIRNEAKIKPKIIQNTSKKATIASQSDNLVRILNESKDRKISRLGALKAPQKTSSFSPRLIEALQQTPSQQLSRTAALEAMGLKKTRATLDKLAEAIDALQLEGAVKKLGGHSVCLVGHMKRGGGDPVGDDDHLLKKPKPDAKDPLVFYFVFAFTTNCQMDVLRMLSVNRHFPNYRCVPVGRAQRDKDDQITGVSKSDRSLLELRRNSPYVVDTDFSNARAFNTSSRVSSEIETVKNQIEEDYKKKD